MIEATLKVKIPESWMNDIREPFRLISCKPNGEKGGRSLVEIKDENAKKIADNLKDYPNICDVDFTDMEDGGVLGTVTTDRCLACARLAGSECFLTSAVGTGNGWVNWNLVSTNSDCLLRLVESLEESGVEVRVVKKKNLQTEDELTNRQREVVRYAISTGYYECPKRTNLKAIANHFDVAVSTISEILQRAEGKIMKERFIGEK